MSPSHIGFVLERSLGHITHADNLRRLLPSEPAIDAELLEINFDVSGVPARVPGFNSNWTVRAGLRARRALRRADRRRRFDGLFIHTQVPAVLAQDWVRRRPTVVSIDATPQQYDELGEYYGHAVSTGPAERLKWHANRSVFRAADHLVTWTEWAKQGLVDGYGIDPAHITVIPPGVVPSLWRRPSPRRPSGEAVRILFVGGDAERKGGDALLEAFTMLRAEFDGALDLALDLVTKSELDVPEGVFVHHGLQPNSAPLVDLFHRADIFCLPSRGDCLPMVLSEAGAASLPLVSTDVAGIPEIVHDGETGLLVPPGDVAALRLALRTLISDPELRARLGAGAERLVSERYDAGVNAHELASLLAATVAARTKATADRRERVLITMSGSMPADLTGAVKRGERPLPDYHALAEVMDAELLDVHAAHQRTGLLGRVIERAAGPGPLLAWSCFRDRSHYAAILTDGEHVGLPLAALCRLTARRPRPHVMIVHLMSTPSKMALYRTLRLGRYVDAMVVYSSEQGRVIEQLGFPSDRVVLTPYAVDTAYFDPGRVEARDGALVASAGLEFRDYPTLIEAVRGLDARVVIAAASHWSKRADTTASTDLPANVEVCSLGYPELRQLYADASVVVVPLYEVPFQAGITTILEAMSMGKTVICSRTIGQTDVIVDGATGVYVPPGDSASLRTALDSYIGSTAATDLGAAARRYCEHVGDVRLYAKRLSSVVDDVVSRHQEIGSISASDRPPAATTA